MLKRLTFALVAISFTVPVVACLNHAADKTASESANMLTDDEKKACNFGFDAVTPANGEPAIVTQEKDGILSTGQPFVWGDANGDGKVDVLAVSGVDKVTLYPGNGDGHFAAGIDTAVSAPANHTAEAIALLGIGDFDGDGKKDVVFAQSTATGQGVTGHREAHYVIGYGKADGTFELVDQGISLKDGEGSKKAKWHSVADLDSDGKDDFVYGGTKGEEVVFGGEADKKLKKVATTITESKNRVYTYATADGLVVLTEAESKLVKFAQADRATTISVKAITLPNDLHAAPTDLDGDGLTELTVFAKGDKKLSIFPLSVDSGPSRFAGFDGSKVDGVDYGVDLGGDPAKKNRQLVFKTDDRKLHAACSYSLTAKEIVAAELPIALGDKTAVVGTPDLNKDGKADFVLYDFGANEMSIFLGGTPSTDSPNPQVTYLAEAAGTEVDAGTDGAVTTDDAGDAGDAGIDADIVVVTDDAGVDAGDAAVDPGTSSSSSSGSSSGNTTTGDDDDDDVKPGSSSGKSSSGTSGKSKGSSSGSTPAPAITGTVTITPKSKPAADDGGCSTTGSGEAPTGSIALGLAVGLVLLGQRRRRAAR